MSITQVGSATTSGGSTTVNVSPTATGDILAVTVAATSQPSGIALSGGGVTTWTNATDYFDTTDTCYVSIWFGVVTATGAATISVAGIGAGGSAIWAQQFNESNATWAWSVASASNAPGSSGPATGSGLTVAYPTLTAAGAGDSLYMGTCFSIFGQTAGGVTSGFTYAHAGTTAHEAMFNPAFAGTVTPGSTQTNTGNYDNVAAIINAAPAGTTVSGQVSALALTAPAGDIIASVPGPVAGLALTAPAGTAAGSGAATVPGAVAQLVLSAPSGAPFVPAAGGAGAAAQGDSDRPGLLRKPWLW